MATWGSSLPETGCGQADGGRRRKHVANTFYDTVLALSRSHTLG